MTSFIKSDIDIVVALNKIDCFLRSLEIKPVLNYKRIEYELERDGKKFLNIKIRSNEIVLDPRFVPGREFNDLKVYKIIEAFILELETS